MKFVFRYLGFQVFKSWHSKWMKSIDIKALWCDVRAILTPLVLSQLFSVPSNVIWYQLPLWSSQTDGYKHVKPNQINIINGVQSYIDKKNHWKIVYKMRWNSLKVFWYGGICDMCAITFGIWQLTSSGAHTLYIHSMYSHPGYICPAMTLLRFVCRLLFAVLLFAPLLFYIIHFTFYVAESFFKSFTATTFLFHFGGGIVINHPNDWIIQRMTKS